jgi:hypothetical protein
MERYLRTLGICTPITQLTESAIEKAWKKALLKAHPDKGGSKEQCYEVTAARNALLEYFACPSCGPDFLNCEECFGKHPDACSCACTTCRSDKQKRDFWVFLNTHPEFGRVFEEMQENLRSQLEAAKRRAEEQTKVEAEKAKAEKNRAARAEAAARTAKAEAARVEAELAKARAKAEAESSSAASSESSTGKQFSPQYYAQIRTELHLGETSNGVKLTLVMVRDRFNKLETRHGKLPPRYQLADRKRLDDLFDRYKETLVGAVDAINSQPPAY